MRAAAIHTVSRAGNPSDFLSRLPTSVTEMTCHQIAMSECFQRLVGQK